MRSKFVVDAHALLALICFSAIVRIRKEASDPASEMSVEERENVNKVVDEFEKSDDVSVEKLVDAIRRVHLNRRVCEFCGITEEKLQQEAKEKDSKDDKLKLCARCFSVFYCSRDHQGADWRKHKATCRPRNQNGQKINESKDASANK